MSEGKFKPYLKERPCKHCNKMFMPYQTKSGRWTKKICLPCKKKQSSANGKKGIGTKRGSYEICKLRKRIEAK